MLFFLSTCFAKCFCRNSCRRFNVATAFRQIATNTPFSNVFLLVRIHKQICTRSIPWTETAINIGYCDASKVVGTTCDGNITNCNELNFIYTIDWMNGVVRRRPNEKKNEEKLRENSYFVHQQSDELRMKCRADLKRSNVPHCSNARIQFRCGHYMLPLGISFHSLILLRVICGPLTLIVRIFYC